MVRAQIKETAPLCGFHWQFDSRVQSATGAGVDCACHHGQRRSLLCTRGRYEIEGRPERNKEERKKETGAEKIMIDLAGKGGRSAQDD